MKNRNQTDKFPQQDHRTRTPKGHFFRCDPAIGDANDNPAALSTVDLGILTAIIICTLLAGTLLILRPPESKLTRRPMETLKPTKAAIHFSQIPFVNEQEKDALFEELTPNDPDFFDPDERRTNPSNGTTPKESIDLE